MAGAAVGDDVMEEDPTVRELEERAAALCGKEAALFAVSGTMTNQLGLMCHLGPLKSLICDARSHIQNWETGGVAYHNGSPSFVVHPENGVHMQASEIEALIVQGDVHMAETAAVALENTLSGTVFPAAETVAVRELATRYGVSLHLDGARLWNAAHGAYEPGRDAPTFEWLAEQVKELCAPFDTVSLCLSKGLGAPVGSLLVSSAERVRYARHRRKVLGGGWRQAGILAAAGLYAIEHNWTAMHRDHENARFLATELLDFGGTLDLPCHTNMVMLSMDAPLRAAFERVRGELAGEVLVPDGSSGRVRLVCHRDISRKHCETLVRALRRDVRGGASVVTPHPKPRSYASSQRAGKQPACTFSDVTKAKIHTSANKSDGSLASALWGSVVAVPFGDVLRDALRSVRSDYAAALADDIGRSVTEATAELDDAASRAAILGECAARVAARYPRIERDGTQTVRVEAAPLGRVLVLSTWNFPAWVLVQAAVPAAVLGNSVHVAFHPRTPRASQVLWTAVDAAARTCGASIERTQLDDSGSALARAVASLDGLWVTGGAETARDALLAAAGALPRCVRVNLELGAADAAIVREDADVDVAASIIAQEAFDAAGQSCSAAQTVFVHRSIAEDLEEKLCSLAAHRRAGNPRDASTSLSALVSRESRVRVLSMIHRAESQGARRLYGGAEIDVGNWAFLTPAVLAAEQHVATTKAEVFGPVVTVIRYDTDAEAVQLHEEIPYGLTARVFTRDAGAFANICSRVRVGTILHNDAAPGPMWTGWRRSGVGASGGEEGAAELLRYRTVVGPQR